MSRGSIAVLISVLISLSFVGCAEKRISIKERAQALEDLGISYVGQGNLREGLAKLLEAEKLDPENPHIQHELGLVYMDLEEYPLARQHFERALSLKPRFPEAQNNLGTLYLRMGEWDLAIGVLKKATSDILYKTPHYAYRNLGLAYFGKGDYEKAIESYKASIKLEPTYAPSHFNLANTYEATQRWDEAVEAYKRAIRYDPNSPGHYYRLGKLYLRLNRREEAAQVLGQFLDTGYKGPEEKEVRELLEATKVH